MKLFRAVTLVCDKEDFYPVIGFLTKPRGVTALLIRTFHLQEHTRPGNQTPTAA